MRNLLPRSNIGQCQNLQRVVISGVRFITVINEPEITLNVESIFLAQPQNMLAIGSCVHTIENTDQLTGTDMFSGEKTFSVDWTVVNVD